MRTLRWAVLSCFIGVFGSDVGTAAYYGAASHEFNTVWTRTHPGGFGNDRAISAVIHGSNLVVAGYETDSGGQTKLVPRVYAK